MSEENTTAAFLAQNLSKVENYFIVIMIAMLIVGILGNILICLVFGQKKYRKNVCPIFCVAASAINILVLLQAAVDFILSLTMTGEPEDVSWFYCKVQLYIRDTLMMDNRTFLILSAASCFALSSERARLRLLTERVCLSYKVSFGSCLFWCFACAHTIVVMNIKGDKCVGSGNYSLIFAIYIFILAGFFSPILMILFSCLALKNLRQMHRRVRPINTLLRLKKRDIQLIRMLLIHMVVYLISTLFYPVALLYLALTDDANPSKSPERQAVEDFISFLTDEFIFYSNNIAPFFIYFATSSNFRHELKNLRSKFFEKFE